MTLPRRIWPRQEESLDGLKKGIGQELVILAHQRLEPRNLLLFAEPFALDLLAPSGQQLLEHGATLLHILLAVLQPKILVLGREILELVGLALGHAHHLVWEAHQLGDVNAKALVADAWLDLVQQRHLALVRLGAVAASAANVRRDVQVGDVWVLVGERRELVKVRGKHGKAADFFDDVLGNGPGKAEAVVGGRAAAELVNDDEGLGRGRLENVGRLEHLGHERRHALELRVAGADAREDGVEDGELGLGAGHEAADLRYEGNGADLADVRRLAAHVGPGDDEKRRSVACEGDVVCDELHVILQLEARVARAEQPRLALPTRVDGRTHVRLGGVDRAVRERDNDIEVRQDAGEALEHGAVRRSDLDDLVHEATLRAVVVLRQLIVLAAVRL
ncbi:hypothetical protein HC256_002784 [Beauveria bassiana]|nr:hypothetical protein HC256_002784 [Beauveria bassiana]